MAKTPASDRRVAAFLSKAQAREDRERARRIATLRRGMASAKLFDHEIHEIEQVVFLAYGRTKL